MRINRDEKLVSIVVTNYNNEKYIEACLNSLVVQSYKNVEIIIVDDSSTDRSLGIIKNWISKQSDIDKQRILLQENQRNLGFSGAVTVGMYLAKGEYIAMQDGDDISHINRIEKEVDFLEKNKNIMLVGCNYSVFEDDVKNAQNVPNFVRYGQEEIKADFARGNSPVCFGTILFRGAVFDEIGGLSRKLDGAEDYEFIAKSLFKGIDNIKETLYYYRAHDKQRSLEFYGPKKDEVKENELRVLLAIDKFNIGGTETYVLALAKGLISRGVHVIIVSGNGPLEEKFRKIDCKIYNVDFPSKIPTDETVIHSFTDELTKIVKQENINLMHCHQSTSGSICLQVADKLNIPCVFTIHGMYYQDIVSNHLKKANKVISVSYPVYKWLWNYNVPSIVIPNGVVYDDFKTIEEFDIRKEYNISEDSLLAMYCSRLAWGKTKVCKNFMRVIRDLNRNRKMKYEAIIIGDGEGFKEVSEMSKRINRVIGREIIHLVGNQIDVNKFYLGSDVVIGTGRVAIEAMAACKKVIASGNSGYYGIVTKENFDDAWKLYFGDHAFRVGNNAAYLYEDMRDYYSNRDIYNQDINDIYNRSKNIFDIKKVTNQILDIYKELYRN